MEATNIYSQSKRRGSRDLTYANKALKTKYLNPKQKDR